MNVSALRRLTMPTGLEPACACRAAGIPLPALWCPRPKWLRRRFRWQAKWTWLRPRCIPGNTFLCVQEARVILFGAHKRSTARQITLHNYPLDQITFTSLRCPAVRGVRLAESPYWGKGVQEKLSVLLGICKPCREGKIQAVRENLHRNVEQ